MKFWHFWSDLSTWNKFGLAFIAAVVVLLILILII